MDEFEVFTIGGGRYLFNFFSAMAAIAQSEAYGAVIASAVMIGTIWMLSKLMITRQWDAVPRYILLITIMLYGGLYPKATVKITDTIDPINSGGYIVANVPLGVAAITGLFTMASHGITTLLEDNLVDVDSPKYAEHGMVFGASLLANATRLEIRDTSFSASMGSFIRQCLFYDILHGRKSMDDLVKAPNPWAYAIADPAVSRWFEIHTPGTASTPRNIEIKTCAAGIPDLSARWTVAIRQASTSLALANAPERITVRNGSSYRADTNQLRLLTAHLRTNLQAFHRHLIGASRASGKILRNQMMINAIMNEHVRWPAEMGNAAALEQLTSARVDIQTERSYMLGGRQAMQWVPAAHATFQAVFAILFLLVFPIWLTPNGTRYMTTYVLGVGWLATWGPVFVVLNYIYTSDAQEGMRAAIMQADTTLQDIPIMARAGIQAVEAKIAASAGNMMVMTSTITLALFAGVGRWAHVAGANVAVAQEANTAAAAEATTGNLSYGNTGWDSHNFGNFNGFHYNTSPSWNSTQSSAVSGTGAMITETGDGRWVASSGSESQFATNVVGDTRLAETFAEERGKSLQAANDNSVNLQSAQSAARGLSNSFTDSVMEGNNADFIYSADESVKASEDISTVKSAAQDWSERHGFNEQELVKAGASVNASAGFSPKIPGGWFSAEAKLAAQANYDALNTTSVSFDDAMKFAQDERVSDALGRLTTAGISQKAGWQLGENQSFAEAQQASYQDIKTFSEGKSAALQRAERMGAAATLVESSSSAINSSLSQPFYEWMQTQPSLKGEGAMGAVEAEALLNSRYKEDRDTAEKLGLAFLEQGGYREISDPRIRTAFEEIKPENNFAANSAAIKGDADIEGLAMINADQITSGDAVRNQLATKSQNITDETQNQMGSVDGDMGSKRKDIEGDVERGSTQISTETQQNTSDQAGRVVGQVFSNETRGKLVDAGEEAYENWKNEQEKTGTPDEPYTYAPGGRIASIMGQPNKLPKDE